MMAGWMCAQMDEGWMGRWLSKWQIDGDGE